MKTVTLLTICLLLSFTILFGQDEIQKEKELIKKVIQSAYVDGLCNNANVEAINQVFHPGFTLIGKGQGKTLWKYPIYNWIESAKAGKMKGLKYSFQDELTTIKFLSVAVAGTIATAKIEF
jgi:Putative lumazine-binding